jgi:hypothetical protein
MEDKWFERTLIVLGIIGLAVLLFAGVANAAGTVCQIPNGCTGTGSSPSYGQLLVGNSSGGYTLTATSSLGITGGGGISWPWISFTNYGTTTVATTTPYEAFEGIFASSTSHFVNADFVQSTTSSFYNTGVTSALASFDANHKETAYAGATSCTNQFFTGLSALGASTCGSVVDADISGQIGLSHGGTNASLSGANQILTMNSGNTAVTTAGAGYTITSTLLSATQASTTLISNFGTAYFGGSSTTTIDKTGAITTPLYATSTFNGGVLLQASSTLSGLFTAEDTNNSWFGISSPTRNLTLSQASSTTWGTGTTSNPQVIAGSVIATFSGTIKTARCLASSTNAFLGVTPFIGSTAMTPSYFVASNTVGTMTFTGNNTFTAGQQIGMYVGTSTSFGGNSGVVCTYTAVQTS